MIGNREKGEGNGKGMKIVRKSSKNLLGRKSIREKGRREGEEGKEKGQSERNERKRKWNKGGKKKR